MNKNLILLFSLFSLSVFGQTRLEPFTEYQLKKLSEITYHSEMDESWAKSHFPELPIYYVNGRLCVSTIAKTNPDFNPSLFRDKYIVTSQVGNIACIKIPLEEIEYPFEVSGIDYLEIAQKIVPDLQRATADARVDSVWNGIHLPQSYTGKDVIIGVTDWGFDFGHPMFMDTALSESRIIAAWDQFKKSGPAPMGMNYGTEYLTQAELAAAESDTAGDYYGYATHGTHVAGIAGGSGAGTVHRGVAFESEFIFNSIRLDVGAAIDANVWCHRIAKQQGKRLVINASWGLLHIGTLDGTSLLSQALDILAQDSSVVLVSSAGNTHGHNNHIKKNFNQDTLTSQVVFMPLNQHFASWGQSITAWGEPFQSFEARFLVYDAANNFLGASPLFNTAQFNGYIDTMLVIGTDTFYYNCMSNTAYFTNNRPHIRLRIKFPPNNRKIVLQAYADSGVVHFWNMVEITTEVANWGSAFQAFGPSGMSGDSDYGIWEPASTQSMITVAAHASEFRSPVGQLFTGNLASFSSKGPLITGYVKPDLSAPGVSINSSINSFTTVSYTPTETVIFNGRTYHFAAFSGTSMSSPMVAGVAALLLQANPFLSNDDIKEILKNSARTDDKTGPIQMPGDLRWGMGKLNAHKAIELMQQQFGIHEKVGLQLKIFPNPSNDIIRIVMDEGESNERISYSLYTLQGKLLLSDVFVSSTEIDLRAYASGVYFIQINSSKGTHYSRIVKR